MSRDPSGYTDEQKDWLGRIRYAVLQAVVATGPEPGAENVFGRVDADIATDALCDAIAAIRGMRPEEKTLRERRAAAETCRIRILAMGKHLADLRERGEESPFLGEMPAPGAPRN